MKTESGTHITTQPSGGKRITSAPQKKPSASSSVEWRARRLITLAEVFKEVLTPECIAIYIESLVDLSDEQFARATFRALQELEWFPKPVKLRELAGISLEGARDIEAAAAFSWVENYLQNWGVDATPIFSKGKFVTPPPLPSRIEYALRRIGGLRILNQVTAQSLPFLRKDFIQAYSQSPLAERLEPRFAEMFKEMKLPGYGNVRTDRGKSNGLLRVLN